MLVRGRVVYFGPNDEAAIDYVRGLPTAEAMLPYRPGMNDAVRVCLCCGVLCVCS